MPGVREEIEAEVAAHLAERRQEELRDKAIQLGFPREKVLFGVGMGREFKLNGKTMREGAHFDPKTGNVVIFTNGLGSDSLLAHEIQHAKWDAVQKAYGEEFHRVVEDDRFHEFESGNRSRGVMRADGSLFPEFEKDYPIYTALQRFYNGSGLTDKLKSSDGVSSYSRDWWEDQGRPHSNTSFDSAVNETLAEIAKLNGGDRLARAKTGPFYKTSGGQLIAPEWARLFHAVNRIYKKITR